MKFGVITFPGSNCDEDLLFSLSQNLGQETVHLWHKDHDLQGCDVIYLPGGFSYGDYLRSGAIAQFSPIMTEVRAHAQIERGQGDHEHCDPCGLGENVAGPDSHQARGRRIVRSCAKRPSKLGAVE